MELECLVCGEYIKIPDSSNNVVCQCCGTAFHVNHDAEFVNGMWRDLTILIVNEAGLP